MSAQRTERLLNLVIALLATRRWVTKAHLRQVVPQYAAARSDEAFDRMFERDKDDLRDLGIPVRTGTHDPLFDDEPGYRIDSEDYALPPVQVSGAELATLGLAAQVWQQANLAGPATRALAKLSALGVQVPPGQPPAARLSTEEPFFDDVYAAVTDRTPISFGYLKDGARTPDRRTLDPWRLRLWHGRWYLHGFDRDRQGDRVFRLSRVRGPVRRVGARASVDVPAGVDSRAAIERRWGAGRRQEAVVEVAPGSGVELRTRAGAELHEPRLHLQVSDLDELAGHLAALGRNARPLHPPALVSAVRALLTRARDAHTGPPGPVPDDLRTGRPPARTPATGATERLARLLALVPYLVTHPGQPIAEVAARFAISEAQLVKDLELVFVCGLPGHLPDDLIEADWESGRVYLDNAETIARPLRLTMDEATALLVGLRALSEVPGATDNAALHSATAKLTEAAGEAAAAAQALSVSLDDDSDPEVRALAEHAVSNRRRLRLRYLVPGRDEAGEREVDPLRVVNLSGAWYLQGWCLRADAPRTFRLSRVLHAELSGAPTAEHEQTAPLDLDAIVPSSPEDLVVVVGLDARHRWVAEQYRPEAVQESEDGLMARIRVWDPASVRQLALRTGGGLRVLSPDWLAEQVRQEAMAALAVTEGED